MQYRTYQFTPSSQMAVCTIDSPNAIPPVPQWQQYVAAYWIYAAALIWIGICLFLRRSGKVDMTYFWYREDHTGEQQVNSADTGDF